MGAYGSRSKVNVEPKLQVQVQVQVQVQLVKALSSYVQSVPRV